MGMIGRRDGVRLRKISGFRKIFPYLMRSRNESVVYFSKRLRISKSLAWLDRSNTGREKKITLFHVILAASVRTLALRPEVNRFVVGRRLYQRRTIDLSFVVKRELTEEASETTLKLTFDPNSTVADVTERVADAIQATKQSRTSSDEKLANFVTSLPRSFIRLAVWGIRTLDYFGLLPMAFIKGDSMFASAFLANLGSIGLDVVFHHMYEWGNAPFFVVVGRQKKDLVVTEAGEAKVEPVVDMNFSVDERITDGVYYAHTFDLFADLIENPEKLETPPSSLRDPFALA